MIIGIMWTFLLGMCVPILLLALVLEVDMRRNERRAKAQFDSETPVTRYLAGKIDVVELGILIGADMGIEADRKLVRTLDPLTSLPHRKLPINDSPSSQTEPVDAILSSGHVRIVMANPGSKTGSLFELEELDRGSLEKVAGWLIADSVGHLTSSELCARITACFGDPRRWQ